MNRSLVLRYSTLMLGTATPLLLDFLPMQSPTDDSDCMY